MQRSNEQRRQRSVDWRDRILPPELVNSVRPGTWQQHAYEQYREKLLTADYPCFFGQSAERAHEMNYTFVAHDELAQFPTAMHRFVTQRANPGHARDSIVAFFEPDPALATHADFVARFWQALRCLNRSDPGSPPTDKSPEDPLWEFSFADCEMFVVGTSPTYRRRRSRNLGLGMALVFQPRNLFIEPKTGKPISHQSRRAVHRRMAAYDGMPVHPDIGFYGDAANREWKQYILPDDNSQVEGICPFHNAD